MINSIRFSPVQSPRFGVFKQTHSEQLQKIDRAATKEVAAKQKLSQYAATLPPSD